MQIDAFVEARVDGAAHCKRFGSRLEECWQSCS